MEVKSNTVKQTIHVSEFQKRAQQYSWNLVCKGYMGDKSIQQRFVWRFEKKNTEKSYPGISNNNDISDIWHQTSSSPKLGKAHLV